MDQEKTIMEPCCIEHSLPRLLKSHPLAVWQTNGDVKFDNIMKAVSCLAGDVITILLVVPVVDVAMLRFLAWFFRRGWLQQVSILTTADQSELIKNELKGYAVKVAFHDSVKEGFVEITGEKGTVIVQGELFSKVSPGHYQYVTYSGRNAEQIRMLDASVKSLFKAATVKNKRAKKKTSPDAEKTAPDASKDSSKENTNEQPEQPSEAKKQPSDSSQQETAND